MAEWLMKREFMGYQISVYPSQGNICCRVGWREGNTHKLLAFDSRRPSIPAAFRWGARQVLGEHCEVLWLPGLSPLEFQDSGELPGLVLSAALEGT